MTPLDPVGLARILDDWARCVSRETNRLTHLFNRNAAAFDHSFNRYRMEALITTLQRTLGVRYCQETLETADSLYFSNPDNLFIHAVIGFLIKDVSRPEYVKWLVDRGLDWNSKHPTKTTNYPYDR